ncbi:amidohydrolase [Streptacidiphilus sp. EB103A]|uniref:amidohydrolase family protein n=1 Tax=Streptacidiphilus sp. EB103A TaxID=3156275 RepID=UPI003515A2C6
MTADLPAPEPPVLDSHVHLWDPKRLDYPWLPGTVLNRSFTPQDLETQLPSSAEVIVVEAGRVPQQAAAEIDWIRDAARTRPWIRGAVAHVPLETGSTATDLIRRHGEDPFVVGVRRNIQDEPVGFTADQEFRTAVRLLGDAGLPFDACVRAGQLVALDELAAACPQTAIVLDHLGKPAVAGAGDAAWRRALQRLARRPNLVCKLSGLATEAAPGHAPTQLLRRYLQEALEIFGPDRCLFGSDWPVMTQATGYRAWLDLVLDALTGQPTQAVDAVLRGNAARVYQLAPDPAGKDIA